MNIKTELKRTDNPEYFKLCINGVDLGLWEKSQVRQLIEDLDKLIHH